MPLTTTATAEKKSNGKPWLDAWHVSPSVNRDYDFIDGLRGVVILMVVIGHTFLLQPEFPRRVIQFVGACIGTGGYGVTLFYALSGFLISWPFWKRKVNNAANIVPQGYAQRRFWKIYPPLALSILVLAPLYIFETSDWSYLTLAAKWLVGWAFILPVSGKMNPVMWTLVRVQFYITLPCLFVFFKRVKPKTTHAVITALFIIVTFQIRAVTKQVATFLPNIDTHYPSALDAFCFGILIAGLENLGVIKKSWVRWGVAGTVLWPLVLLVAAWVSIHYPGQSFASTEVLYCLLSDFPPLA